MSEWTRVHVNYGDIIYGRVYKNSSSFLRKLESSQCNANVAGIGVIRGTSEEISYQKPGLDSSPFR